MTTQPVNQKRGLRSWIARTPIALLTLLLVLSAGTWVASASVKSNLTRQYPAPG